MKKLLLSIPLLFSATIYSQVGIGAASPHSSAMLDVVASDKGLLIPRVALTSAIDQTTIPSPAIGLLAYNTGAGTLTYKGFVFWNGTEWRSINNTSTINPAISGLTCSGASAFPQTFTSGTPYSGTLTVPYSNGNGGSYQGGSPFTQNGLTFTLNPGTLNSGNGAITYSVSGIPDFSSPNTATIPLNFLGYSCNTVIGDNSSSFAIGEIKSVRIIVPATLFLTNTGSRSLMTGKAVNNITTTNRRVAYELASLSDQTKFIIINGLRMDFMKSALTNNPGSVSPKFFNTASTPITYNISSLSTNDAMKDGLNTVLAPTSYSYNIDGNDDFSVTSSSIEYVNAMVTFNNGEWYNCTWHATRDTDNYYFYMTAQRLN